MVTSALTAAALTGGVAASAALPDGARSPSALVMRTDIGIGGVRIGESRRDLTDELGDGRAARVADGLGVCSGGLCRIYRVDRAIIGVDFTGPGVGVAVVGTRARVLTVDGHRPAAGFAATRRALSGWHVLRCTGRPGGWLMFKTAATRGPYSSLMFTRDTFTDAFVSTGTPPRGCAFAVAMSHRH
jgi:hypothetical protein